MADFTVLETNVLHASDVLYWLDGSTAELEADMLRLAEPVHIQFSNRPRDLQVLHTAGKTALWRRPVNDIVSGIATDADKTPPAEIPYLIAGTVSDPAGRYNPRLFSLNAGGAAGHALTLFPSPLGVRFGASGGLLGSLRWQADAAPVPWALLTLTVTTALAEELIFRAQSNQHGDFLLPLTRLPPLPEGITDYAASLQIDAHPDASADAAIDPDTLSPVEIGDFAIDNSFATSVALQVVPGEVRPLRTLNRAYVAVQPS